MVGHGHLVKFNSRYAKHTISPAANTQPLSLTNHETFELILVSQSRPCDPCFIAYCRIEDASVSPLLFSKTNFDDNWLCLLCFPPFSLFIVSARTRPCIII